MVQTATQRQLPPIEKSMMVPLTSLVHLKDTEIEGAEKALRSPEHVIKNARKLRETFETLSQEEWPTLEAVEAGEGAFIVLDGYTRWEAAKEGKQNVERDKDGNTLNPGTPIDALPVNVRLYSSNDAIVRAAYNFNKEHGNPYTDGEKGTFALYLYDLMTEENNGVPPSLRDVARESDFSHVLLWKRLKKRESDLTKKNQGKKGEQAISNVKTVKRFVSLIKGADMRFEAKQVNDAQLVNLFAETLGSTVTTEDIAFLRRLSSTLVKTATKLEKSTLVQSTLEGQIEASEPEGVEPETVKAEEAQSDATLTPAKKGTSKKTSSTRKKETSSPEGTQQETPSLIDETIEAVDTGDGTELETVS